jgi:hypothetical protein
VKLAEFRGVAANRKMSVAASETESQTFAGPTTIRK